MRLSFEDDGDDQAVLDLYNEKSGLLDQEDDTEVDLASYAYEIWKTCHRVGPSLLKTIPDLAPVSFATKGFCSQRREAPRRLALPEDRRR